MISVFIFEGFVFESTRIIAPTEREEAPLPPTYNVIPWNILDKTRYLIGKMYTVTDADAGEQDPPLSFIPRGHLLF